MKRLGWALLGLLCAAGILSAATGSDRLVLLEYFTNTA